MSELVYRCPCVPDRIRIWNCWFLRRGENRSTRRKTFWCRGENILNPHMASTPGFEPGPHWWEASALTTAPPLPLIHVYTKKKYCVLVYCVHLDKVAFSIRDIFMSSQSSKTKCSKASMRFWSDFTPSLPYTFCIRTKTG